MKACLVTGGAGFIGSHMVRLLAELNAFSPIVVVDDLRLTGSWSLLGDTADSPAVHLIEKDITDHRAVADVFAEFAIEAVFHFAAESHVDRSLMPAAPFTGVNTHGTAILAEQARRVWPAGDKQRFVHVSTDEVYGPAPTGTFDERQPLAPKNPYAASKAGAEHYLHSLYHCHQFPVVVGRGCNTYGPGQHWEKLIPKALWHWQAGKAFPVYGSGQQQREWIHVGDHCRALLALWQQGQCGETYNIGTGLRLTNLQVLHSLYQEWCRQGLSLSWDAAVVHVDDRLGHDIRYALDCSKIRRSLQWQPSVSWPDGMAETVQSYL